MAEQHGVSADHTTRGDHRRRMDERGHGRRTFHRVRQPDEERNLRGLAGAPRKSSSVIIDTVPNDCSG